MLRKIIIMGLLMAQTAQATQAQMATQSNLTSATTQLNVTQANTTTTAPVRPLIQQRVGVDSSKPLALTIQEAIALALENNRDIEVERITLQRNEYQLSAAQGIFDATIASSFSYNRHNTPVTSLLAGGDNGKVKSSDLSSTITLAKRFPWQGGDFKVSFENNRYTSENLFNALEPEYRTGLNFEFTQPLWRNRTTDNARREIKLKVKQLNLSDLQFRQRVIDVITQVKNAYWDLVFAYRDEEIKRESVQLAQTQLEYNQRLVDKGVMAPSDVISARVEIERRTDEAEAALQFVQRAENALKVLMLQPTQTELWNTMLMPVDQPQIDAPQQISLDSALKLAFQLRPEMEQYQVRAEMNRVDVEYYRNQSKPEVNFIAKYGTTGLAGIERNAENPIEMANRPLFSRINQLSQLAGLSPLTPFTTSPEPMFVGGYGQSLSNLFGNKFSNWQVGININFSLGNRTAKAQLGQSLAEGRQVDVERQRTQQSIEVEVRNVLQSVKSAYRRVEVAHNSQQDALMQYQAEERKFEAGLSTNFLMLDRQNALAAARGREVKALTDYNKALTDLQRALSTTLSGKNIEISKHL